MCFSHRKLTQDCFFKTLLTIVYLFTTFLATINPSYAKEGRINLKEDLTTSTKSLVKPKEGLESAQHQYLLYSILVAEMAAQRNMPAIALSRYLELARLTQNPKIAREATEWAIEFQAPEEALLASEYWAKMAPNDLQAQMVATTLVIGYSINRALPYLTRAIELDPKEIGQHLIAIQSRLSSRSADHLKMALFHIAKRYPKNAYASLAAAQSAAQQEDIPNATLWVDKTLELQPNLTAALELKARLIRYHDNSDTAALNFLKERVLQYSDNPELRLFYATALVDASQYKDAIYHLKLLSGDKTYGGQALIYLGEAYRKDNDFDNSVSTWKKAMQHEEMKDNAQFLLGELMEQRNHVSEAVLWFTTIDSGPFHITAQLRAAELLKKNKDFDKAIQVLHDANPTTADEQKQLYLSEIDILATGKKLKDAMNLADEVLTKIPTDEDMLLMHSLVAIKMKQWSLAEKDLKTILQQNANNAEALNTLGYILSLQPERRQEAKQYIEQALSIAPNNPAYLDSLGWLYFKMGDAKKALEYLSKATELSNDPEIAAHLGEVMWALGKKEEAKVVWGQALYRSPKNEVLKETLVRHNVDLKPIKIVHH